MALTLILAVGQDPMVLSTRCSILQSAGYIVRSACSVAESIDSIQNADFDLLLLCHSIPLHDRDWLIRFIRSTGSQIPIYGVASAALEFQAGLANGVLASRPDDLIKQLRDVVEVAHRTMTLAQCH